MTYEKFEHKAISKLLEGNDPIFERLFDQFLDAEVLKREETEGGFVVDFEVSKALSVGGVTRQISAVSVMLAEEEMLLLELSVSAGLITQLQGTYTSKLKYSEILPKFSDLTFLYVPSNGAVTRLAQAPKVALKPADGVVNPTSIAMKPVDVPEAPTAFNESDDEGVKRNKIFSTLRGEKKHKPEEIEPTQDVRLVEQAKHLSIQHTQAKELLEQEQAKNLQLQEEAKQSLLQNAETQKLLEEEKARNMELIKESDQLFSENTQIKERLEQEQVRNAALIKKSNELFFEHAQAQDKNATLLEQSDQLRSESDQVKAQNTELVEKSNEIFSEKIEATKLLEEERVRNSELVKKSNQIFFENIETKELLEQEQARNIELAKSSEQLSMEGVQNQGLLEQEQARNSELVKKSSQLFFENIEVKELLELEQARNTELVEKSNQLFFENIEIKALLEQAQIKEEAKQPEPLISESSETAEVKKQEQAENLTLSEEASAFQKDLEALKFKPEAPASNEDQELDEASKRVLKDVLESDAMLTENEALEKPQEEELPKSPKKKAKRKKKVTF